MDSTFPEGISVMGKQSHPGIELGSSIPFPMMIAIKLIVPLKMSLYVCVYMNLFYVHVYLWIYFSTEVYVCAYVSTSSHDDNTDFLDFQSPFVSIIHLSLAGLLDCIQCLHRADVCKSMLISQHRHVHV